MNWHRSEVVIADLAEPPGGMPYVGGGRFGVIVSPDSQNQSGSIPDVMLVPRTTRVDQVSEETPNLLPAGVFSPAGDGGCNKPGVVDCFVLLRAAKDTPYAVVDGHVVSRLTRRVGRMPGRRVAEIDEGLRGVLESRIPNSIWNVARNFREGPPPRFPRGSVVMFGGATESGWTVVLSNDAIRRRRRSRTDFSIVVGLEPLSDEDPTPPSPTAEVIARVGGTDARFAVLPWTARCLNTLLASEVRAEGAPIRFSTSESDRVAQTVIRYLSGAAHV